MIPDMKSRPTRLKTMFKSNWLLRENFKKRKEKEGHSQESTILKNKVGDCSENRIQSGRVRNWSRTTNLYITSQTYLPIELLSKAPFT